MKLIDFFADWRGNGIFSHMGSWVPWYGNSSVVPAALDWQYFGNRSGWRNPSPLLMKILPPFQVLSVEQIDSIENILRSMYEQKWTRLWSAMNLSYNLNNDIDLTETHTGKSTGNSTENTEANTKSHTDNKTSNRVVPFGSSNGTYSEVGSTDTDIDTESLIANNHGKRTISKSDNDSYTKRRVGKNGGVTMSKRVEEEIALRRQTYFDIIMSDIDDVLTIPYWG